MRVSKKTWVRVATGAALTAGAVLALPSGEASARGTRQNRGGVLKVTDIDVGDTGGVAQNHIVNIYFTQLIDPASVSPASIRVRAINATRTYYSIDVPGTFQVQGSVVRFYPRLPTHLRDPLKTDGSFYSAGNVRDDAYANAGFQPSKAHRITVIGSSANEPGSSPVRSLRGRTLDRNYSQKFTTSPVSPKTEAFSQDAYQDAPPPGFEFSNPPDKVSAAAELYARHGGSQDVPSAAPITIFGNKVPLSPASVRQSGNVAMTIISRKGDPGVRKPIAGTPYVEQNFDTVRLVFQPQFGCPTSGPTRCRSARTSPTSRRSSRSRTTPSVCACARSTSSWTRRVSSRRGPRTRTSRIPRSRSPPTGRPTPRRAARSKPTCSRSATTTPTRSTRA